MPVSTTDRVDGLQALGESMRELSRDVALRVAGQSTNAGAQLIKKQAKRNIEASPSVQTRSLLDAVIVNKVPKSQTSLTAEHLVTVRGRGKKKTKGKQTIAPHAHFVEFGTVNMRPEPFLAPAFDTEKERAVAAIAEKLKARIEAVRPK